MKFIDFSSGVVEIYKAYNGSNGKKISLRYDGVLYMVKSSPKPKNENNLEYTNSCVSEYIGSHIFSELGIDSQVTFLGEYKNKFVVACKDFTDDGSILLDFNSINNTIFDSTSKQNSSELADILIAIDEQNLLDNVIVMNRFWDMFIVDALLGNFDRHSGNWGFLTNKYTNTIKLAPVYDCGSCLYPQADNNLKESILVDEKVRDERIYVFPNSTIKNNGKKINYFQFLSTTDNQDCLNSLKKILGRYNQDNINSIVDNTPTLSDLDKKFYKYILEQRKIKILDYSLKNNPNINKIN